MREYNHHGIYFAYPENWTLEENDIETAEGSVSVSNEQGAFWTLQKYPFGTDPDDIVRTVLETMQSEYTNTEWERFEKIVSDKLVVGFEMTFFYLDLMNLAVVLCFEQDEQTFAVYWQTGNQLIIHDGKTVPAEKVMEAISHSLLYGGSQQDTDTRQKKRTRSQN